MKIKFNHEGKTLPDSHGVTDEMMLEMTKIIMDFTAMDGNKLSILSEMMDERLDQRVILMFAVEKVKDLVEMSNEMGDLIDDLLGDNE